MIVNACGHSVMSRTAMILNVHLPPFYLLLIITLPKGLSACLFISGALFAVMQPQDIFAIS